MALKTAIAGALRGPIALLEREFGTLVRLRRPEYTEASDGSVDMELVKVTGVSETLRIIITETNVEALAKEWGRETGATIGAIASDKTPWQPHDVLAMREDGAAGRFLEVARVQPVEAGGIVMLALKEAAMDLDALDKGF